MSEKDKLFPDDGRPETDKTARRVMHSNEKAMNIFESVLQESPNLDCNQDE